eukprot:4194339-Prymnesium_polylepis.2
MHLQAEGARLRAYRDAEDGKNAAPYESRSAVHHETPSAAPHTLPLGTRDCRFAGTGQPRPSSALRCMRKGRAGAVAWASKAATVKQSQSIVKPAHRAADKPTVRAPALPSCYGAPASPRFVR